VCSLLLIMLLVGSANPFSVLAAHRSQSNSLVINEFMASNSSDSGISDPQGEYDDWVEIYNFGDTTIDIGGMYLTDDINEPAKWHIPGDWPAETTVGAGDYIAIWADGDTGDGPLHANFKLNADSEEIGLFNADGSTMIDGIIFGKQVSNISYGRYPDAINQWRYMTVPTPGTQNNDGYLGFVDEVEISHLRGFYENAFEVELTCETNDATIYYTLNGNEPNETTGTAYNPNVRIPITTTTCLRAASFKPGYKSSRVNTCTYIFLDDVRYQSNSYAYSKGFPVRWINRWDQYLRDGDYEMDPDILTDPAYSDLFETAMKAIPVLSIVTDMANLFDPQTGIYVNNWQWHDPQSGQDWERPVSLEYFDPCTAEDFQIDAGLRLAGNQSRDPGLNAKHSMRIFFKSEYGPSMLEFPLYENSDADRHNNISLRANYHYSWIDSTHPSNVANAHYIRDTFAQDSLRDMGCLSPDSRYVHLYMNGLYWGLYQASERPDDSFLAEHLGGEREDYDVIEGVYEHSVATVECKAGLRDSWDYMWSLFEPYDYHNPMDAEDYAELTQHLDIVKLCDYIIYNTFVTNWDWCSKNWYAASLRNPQDVNGPPLGKWTFYTWDAETTMDSYRNFHGFPFSGYYNAGPGFMHNALHNNPEYNRLLGDRIHKFLFNNGALTEQRNIDRFEARAEQIENAIIAESARWGDFLQDDKGSYPLYTPAHWHDERDRMINPDHPGGGAYLPNRTNWLLTSNYNSYISHGFYPNIDAPKFSQHGGYISAGDMLTITNPNGAGTVYYTLDGIDPAMPGMPPPPVIDTTFVAENASKQVLVPTGQVDDAWKGGQPFDDSSWSLCTGSAGGVGYERGSGYEHFISLDVESQMYGRYSGCYVRIPFYIDEAPNNFSTMIINVRYDDGFIAYINGVEVQRVLVSGTPRWDTSASGNHEATGLQPFDISDETDILRQGRNILAIHGLNASLTSSDFIISAELAAGRSDGGGDTVISDSAFEYAEPAILTKTTQVKARVLSNGVWSALNEAVFGVGPVKESLRITEIMYHPADYNDPNDPDTEYIELANIGSQAINLNLVKFANGINFTFSDANLPPGDYIVVVKNQSAFLNKYPSFTGTIAGQYSGSLNNGGERVELQDAVGQTIHNFRYEDNWYDITDGLGFSLVIKDPVNTDPNAYSDKANWRPSATIGGSPGYEL